MPYRQILSKDPVGQNTGRHCYKCGKTNLPYGCLVHTECLNTTEPLEYGHCYCCGDKTNSRYNIFCPKHSPPKHPNPVPNDELKLLVYVAVCCRCEARVTSGVDRDDTGTEWCEECKKNYTTCKTRLAMVWMLSCEHCLELRRQTRLDTYTQADQTGKCIKCKERPFSGSGHTCRECQDESNRQQREGRHNKKK